MAKREHFKIDFLGMNADNVTGSMTWVHDKEVSILLEAGLYQSNDILSDYHTNNRNLNFNIKKVDFIILGHVHADHSMLIPRLYAEGCTARIICPKGTAGFYRLMGLDSAYIVERDCAALDKKYNKSHHRIYTAGDVERSLGYIEEYPIGEKIELTDRITIQFTPSGHIVSACQVELWLRSMSKTNVTKVLYTSDLGNISIPKYYSTEFSPVEKANIVIGECTYNDPSRTVKASARAKDLIKMKEIIGNSKGIVEIPIFTLDRCPNILTILYDLFGEDENFTTDVVVDSPLAVKMLEEYMKVLDLEGVLKLNKVLSWKNVKLISEANQSRLYMSGCKKAVVLSASGMLSKGRSRLWLKHIIESENNTIMFVGYSANNTLATKIKEGKRNKKIVIDDVEYKNKCNIVSLRSFTSHMQYEDLLNYYSSISADKVCLVHSDKEGKLAFTKDLQKKIEQKNGRARVVCVNYNTSIHL